MDAAIAAGLEVDEFASQLSFFFNAHNNFFEEIAKFRAARRMWARIMRNRFHSKVDKSQMLRFHTQTAGSTLTAQQPENNVVRVTMQALSAILGGTQSLHTNSMDEALWLPTEKSVRVALRTQQIIANESGVADTIDPLAGSYFLEQLTDEIEEKAMAYIEKIDSLGGSLAAIEQGYMQREIQAAAYAYQKNIEKGMEVVVGVNKFNVEETLDMEALKVNPEVESSQILQLRQIRENRDAVKINELMETLARYANGSENLLPLFIECVENDMTLGEICGVLREVWGEYHSASWV